MPDERRVKNHKLFDPPQAESFCDLATRLRYPQNAHGVSKIDFLRMHKFSIINIQFLSSRIHWQFNNKSGAGIPAALYLNMASMGSNGMIGDA